MASLPKTPPVVKKTGASAGRAAGRGAGAGGGGAAGVEWVGGRGRGPGGSRVGAAGENGRAGLVLPSLGDDLLQNGAPCIAAPSSCPYSGAQLQSFLAGNLPADAPVFFTTGGVFGRLTIPGNLTYSQPGTGATSLAAALLFSGSGFAIKNYLTDFDAATGAGMPGFAQQIQGLDFLGSPIVADVSGDGQPDLVVGADSSALMAYRAGGEMPGGFPKFTTGWAVWAPSSGDLLSDGQTDIVQLTRDGYVFACRHDGTYAVDQDRR